MLGDIKGEIEDKVIDAINMSSGGRLVVVKPEKDKTGINLIVERKGNYKDKPFSFQIHYFTFPSENGNFIKDFNQKMFQSDKNLFMIFVFFDEITRKINNYIWLIPSKQFEDIAETIKLDDGNKILRFEASLNSKDKFSKFLVDNKEIGKMIFGALESKKDFEFKEKLFEEVKKIDLEKLFEFVTEARQNTFAGGGLPIDNPRLSKSTQLEFQKGDFFYRDVHFSGNLNFSGQEVVYQNQKPIWVMNYKGTQIGKLEIRFLKEALYSLYNKARLGGKCEYAKREFRYQDSGQGGIDSFYGQEVLFMDNKNIYKLDYMGGLLSDIL